MSYSLVKSVSAEYAVDWEVIERFCKSYWLTYYQSLYSSTTSMSESTWYNPFSWSLPTLYTLDVDWDKARSAAQSATASDLSGYSQNAAREMRDIALEVKWKVEQTAVNRRNFTDALKAVQAASLAEMERASDDYTGLIEACRFVRDTSANVVAIGSTIATGGAAVGLLGVSSSLKGYGKYQDTGKAGPAVLYGAGSMLVGAFKVGGTTLKPAGEFALIIGQGALEAGTSFAAGDSFAKAVEKGGLKVASTGAAQMIFSASVVKRFFSKMPIPFNVTVTNTEGLATDKANVLVEKISKKMTEKTLASAGRSGLDALRASAPDQPRTVSTGLIDEVPIEQMFLLYLAIVHMEKGVGRGW